MYFPGISQLALSIFAMLIQVDFPIYVIYWEIYNSSLYIDQRIFPSTMVYVFKQEEVKYFFLENIIVD